MDLCVHSCNITKNSKEKKMNKMLIKIKLKKIIIWESIIRKRSYENYTRSYKNYTKLY